MKKSRVVRNRRALVWGLACLLCLLALSTQPANAQVVFGSLVGNVTDASGSAVPGAMVKITNVQTNDSRSVTANDVGAYTIATVTPGTYNVEVTKEGFRAFVAPNVLVNQNNIVRVDAQLPVGNMTEKIEVMAEAAALETDRADVHAEVTASDLTELPQANRSYHGLMELIPGAIPPGGQLSGGTNNPSKAMTFGFNGSGTTSPTVRIEGINAINLWVRSYQSYVPSVEAIQNVNVATNANDAEQGVAGGASVNVMLKSGTNETHGAVYEYNIDSVFEANNFFSPTSKPPHLVDNNFGGFMGGHILKNRLFYFGSYEVDLNHSSDSAILSIPNVTQLSGNMSASGNPVYDPATGTPDGKNRTPFPGNIIPANRISPVALKIIPNIPATNVGGPNAVVNNFYLNRATVYNLHKIDTKLDYNVTPKLRLSGRFGYQPYYNFQQPIYGEVLGGTSSFPQSGAGNYLQHGAGLAVSGSGSYVISPTFVVDATWGKTSSHQLLFPNKSTERYGSDVLGIPGTNVGPLPWAGGVPNFAISNFVTMGASYPALEYLQPQYEYVANASKVKGSHTIRFGGDVAYQHPQHIEVRNNTFTFNGGITTLNGGPGANPYNALSDFLLGSFYEGTNWRQVLQPYLTMRQWEIALYVRDQWHISRKLTVNYGVRWEKYPVPTRDGADNRDLGANGTGIYFLDFGGASVSVCGTGSIPTDCGIHVSNKLFAPSLGIAYRPNEKWVVRTGYSLSPYQEAMGTVQMQAFPGEVQIDLIGVNPYTPAGNLTTGLPIIPPPVGNNGNFPLPPNTGNVTAVNSKKDFVRGYYQSYNITVQRELPAGMVGSIGYVGTHAVHLQTSVGLNYGQLGGGTASQPLAYLPDFSTGITTPLPWGNNTYNSLQATLNRRLAQGLTIQAAYTYSKDIGMTTSILIPQYTFYDHYRTSLDRTHHFVVSSGYELPFGKGKRYVHEKVPAAILGGWSLHGIFNHYSGTPLSVSSSAASCNCPGNSQTADQVLGDVAVVGAGVGGQAYFDPLAYKPVTGARFGTSGFNTLRGPGNTDLDLSLFRTISMTERFKVQIRGEALNATNTPHFSNPAMNVSNLQLNPDGTVKSLNGFSQITSTAPLGRIQDQRYFRFGFRFIW